MVVDAEVDEDVGKARVAPVALDDEQCCGLLAAPIPACGSRGGERLEEPIGEWFAAGRLERLDERIDRLARDEDVALRRVAVAAAAARPAEAARARERCRPAVRVDDPELPLTAS